MQDRYLQTKDIPKAVDPTPEQFTQLTAVVMLLDAAYPESPRSREYGFRAAGKSFLTNKKPHTAESPHRILFMFTNTGIPNEILLEVYCSIFTVAK